MLRLSVRYAIQGSVQKIDSTLKVNVQLTSAEIWSDRIDEQITELAAGQSRSSQ